MTKDTNIERLIINKNISRKKFNEMRKNGQIDENELYFVDESEPIGYGMWAEECPGKEWMQVDGVSELSADDYPKLWEILIGTLDKTLENSDFKVCTVEEVSNVILNTKDWERLVGEQKIAYYYIVDRSARTFKLPRCLSYEKMCTIDEVTVIEENNGCSAYSISNYGAYYERSLFGELQRATKTIVDETTNKSQEFEHYNLIIRDRDSGQDIIMPMSSDILTPDLTEDFRITLRKELINNKYSIDILNTIPFNDRGDNGEIILDLYESITGFGGKYRTTKEKDSFITSLYLYDTSVKIQNLRSMLKDDIPNGLETTVLACVIEGYVIPPLVQEYTTSYRLYIKVA